MTPPKLELELPLPDLETTLNQLAPVDLVSSAMTTVHHDESDMSSIISTSEGPVFSESDDSDGMVDVKKYRLPDFGKAIGSPRDGLLSGTPRDEDGPTPPPKDSFNPYRHSASASMEDVTAGSESYFNPYGLTRANSVYTLSRASFSNQISQLTSIKLPNAASLSSSISAIPNSNMAAKALNDAADQIRLWIKKATEVLEGLDAEDDVEWAAAGGRDGVGEVDVAINTFEQLIDVYVGAIEELEHREDIDTLSSLALKAVVDRMERIHADWSSIKNSLEGVKQQVEVAMEWEELWNTVLGEIGMEEENLSRHIFEMEERRHKSTLLDSMAETGQSLDIKELETIVEEAPTRPVAPVLKDGQDSDDETNQKPVSHEDSNLLALYARMQPLRASLDFLPMRLSAFLGQARSIFPSACEELETRVDQLESRYRKLESDAESLRKELGEDRWVVIFRKAGKQALKMCESVERSITKLREALDEGTQHSNPAQLTKRIENYEAKKEHYGPAIHQVFSIIDRGVQTRLTVNGEILRLQADMQRRWNDIEAHTKGMDFALDQLNVMKNRQLRDSVSTILSEHRSITSSTGTLLDTPGSSPASSVVLLSRHSSEHGATSPYDSKSRQGSFTSSTTARAKRFSSLPVANTPGGPRKTPLSKSSSSNLRVSGASSRLYPPVPPRSVSRTEVHTEARPSKPRWNSSTKTGDSPIGHNFTPLSATTPSPYRKQPPLRNQRSFSSGLSTTSTSVPSPLSRSFHTFHSGLPTVQHLSSQPSSTAPPSTPQLILTKSTRPRLSVTQTNPFTSMKTPSKSAIPRPASMFMTPNATPGTPYEGTSSRHVSRASIASSTSSSTATILQKSPFPTPGDTPSGSSILPSIEHSDLTSPSATRKTNKPSRPTTALGGRRASLLPTPRGRVVSSSVVPSSAQATAAAQAAMSGRTTPVFSRSVSSVTSGRTTPVVVGPGGHVSRAVSRTGFGFGRLPEEGAFKAKWR